MYERLTVDHDPQVVSISEIKSLDYLIRQYPNQAVIPQFRKLQQTYPCYRAVRGDGNCFYRAMAFLYLRQADLKHFSNVFQSISNQCVGFPVQFEDMSFESAFLQIYQNFLYPLRNSTAIDKQAQLKGHFNNSFVFDTLMIIYFRSLNYKYIKDNPRRFGQFVTNQEIEKIRVFGNDSEGIQYNGMAESLNITIVMKVTDEHNLTTVQYNKGNYTKTYDFFYRPGHFDILYQKNCQFIPQNRTHQSPYLSERTPRNPNSLLYQKEYLLERKIPAKQKQNEQNWMQKRLLPTIFQKPKSTIFGSDIVKKQKNDTKQKNQINNTAEINRDGQTKQQHSNKKKQSPFISMNKLRSNSKQQTNGGDRSLLQHVQQEQAKPSQIFSKPHNIEPQRTPKLQEYAAWSNQKDIKDEGSKKYKESFILCVFLAFIFYVAYRI